MELGLSGKAIVITGASRGIGLSIADLCAEEGASVAICGRTQSDVDAAKAQLERHGGTVHAALCDVGNADEIIRFIDQAAEALGAFHGLANNPSAFGNGDNEDSWQKCLDVDLMGHRARYMGRTAAPQGVRVAVPS